jgi:hypothetical protein
MIIKEVEEKCNCKTVKLQNENKIEKVDDKEGPKEVSVLYFKATLKKN